MYTENYYTILALENDKDKHVPFSYKDTQKILHTAFYPKYCLLVIINESVFSAVALVFMFNCMLSNMYKCYKSEIGLQEKVHKSYPVNKMHFQVTYNWVMDFYVELYLV